MPTINLYTWHKSKGIGFLQVQQEKTESSEPSHQGFLENKSGDLISWYGLGQDCWSLVIQFAYESNSISWSNVEVSNRNSTFSFPHKKRASQILPHDAGFGWPQFQKNNLRLWHHFDVVLCGNFLPTNFRRCDLPPCTPALGKDPPAMPRSLSRYLHSTGTLF